MTVNVKARAFVIDANDAYVLNTAIPDSDRKQTLVIGIRRNGAYDGTVLIQSRPRGSALAFITMAYQIVGTGAFAAAALGAADVDVQIDATGKEIQMLSAARTVNSLNCYVTDAPES